MSSAHGSKKSLYVALAANTGIAVCKFGGALYTGSSAMLSEGVHSLVDTGNQLLLLFGMKDSSRQPDASHPFGYGLRLYFWGFVVAMMVFALGSLVAINEGIEKVRHPHDIQYAWVNYIILVIAIVLEGGSLRVALQDVAQQARKRKLSMLETIRRHRDPTVFAIVWEETAALAGLVIALIGLGASQVLSMPVIDGYTSIGIGLVLAFTSFSLARKCYSLMTGQAADPELSDRLWNILEGIKLVKEVNEIRTMHFGPDEVTMLASVDYHDEYNGKPITSRTLESITSDVSVTMREEFPGTKLRIYIEPQSNTRHLEELQEMGEEADALYTEEELAAEAAEAEGRSAA